MKEAYKSGRRKPIRLFADKNPMKCTEVKQKHKLACIKRSNDKEYRAKLAFGIKERSNNIEWIKSLKKPRKGKVKVICGTCGKIYYIYPSWKTEINFCSNKCRAVGRKGRPNVKNSKPKIVKICLYCKKEFQVTPSQKDKVFCSMTCRNYFYIEHPHYCGVKRPTNIELLMDEILKQIGINYTSQQPIRTICIADFALLDKNIVIFVDGDYWHANPIRYCTKSLNKTQRRNVGRDKKVNNVLKNLGWKVLRFWEHNIINNRKEIKDMIIKEIA